tara:strand:+ start:210 stop:962 length:753 start_codon:yes stop_codon:yes gene_type:complete
MITTIPRMLGPLLIGGGITQANPDMLKDLLETFASSPLAQVLRARDDDVIDLDEEREKREAENETSVEEKAEEIKEKAKDIEKEGSAADQFDDIMGDLFGVRRREKKVIDFPDKEESVLEDLTDDKPVPEAKPTEELEGFKKAKEEFDKAKVVEKDPGTGEERELSREEIKSFQTRAENLKRIRETIEAAEKIGFKTPNKEFLARELEKELGDDAVVDYDEIKRKLEDDYGAAFRMGGPVDKAIAYEPRN